MDGYRGSNPYYFGALADGIYKGFGMYSEHAKNKAAEKQQGFENEMKVKDFGLREQAQKSDESYRQFQMEDALAGRDLQNRQLEESVRGNKASEGIQREGQKITMRGQDLDEADRKRRFSLDQSKFAWDKDPNNADNKLKEAQATAAKEEANPDGALARYRNAQADQMELETEGLRDIKARTDRNRQAHQFLEDAREAVVNPQVAGALGALVKYGQDRQAGKAEGGPKREDLAQAVQVLFGRNINAMKGKTTKELNHYFSDNIPPGKVLDVRAEGADVDPSTGKIHPVMNFIIKQDDGRTATYKRVMARQHKESGKFQLADMDVDDAYNRLVNVMGVKAELNKNGVFDQNSFNNLQKDMLLRMALDGDKSVTMEALDKMGNLGPTPDDVRRWLEAGVDPQMVQQWAASNGLQVPTMTGPGDLLDTVDTNTGAPAGGFAGRGLQAPGNDGWGKMEVTP